MRLIHQVAVPRNARLKSLSQQTLFRKSSVRLAQPQVDDTRVDRIDFDFAETTFQHLDARLITLAARCNCTLQARISPVNNSLKTAFIRRVRKNGTNDISVFIAYNDVVVIYNGVSRNIRTAADGHTPVSGRRPHSRLRHTQAAGIPASVRIVGNIPPRVAFYAVFVDKFLFVSDIIQSAADRSVKINVDTSDFSAALIQIYLILDRIPFLKSVLGLTHRNFGEFILR